MADLLRHDAVWTWFHDPRAVHHNGTTYVTWSANDGIWIGAFDGTELVASHRLRATGANDHHVAAVGIRPDGRLLVAYSEHNDSAMRVRISERAGDITRWGSEIVANTGDITYPNLLYLAGEERWYLFMRNGTGFSGRPPVYVTSDDDGASWSAEQLLTVENAERPYLKVVSDGIDQMHLLLTDKHPQVGAASVFHLHYDAGTWRDSFGVDVGLPPIAHSSMTLIHDGTVTNAWIWDIALDGGTPLVAFTHFPTDTDHRYMYGRWVGDSWDVHQVVRGGRAIDETGTEPHYSGGLVFDHDDPSVMWVSRQATSERWDVERWELSGGNWTSTVVAQGSPKAARPVAVRGVGPIEAVWFDGQYLHYFDFDTALYGLVEEAAAPGPGTSTVPASPATIRPAVTWLGCDAATGRIISELPDLEAGDIGRALGNYVSASASVPIPLSGPGSLGPRALQATEPERTLLVAVINDVPAWAGYVLRRDGGTDAALQLGCVTPEGYLGRREVRNHDFAQVDEAVIASTLAKDAEDIDGFGQGLGLVHDAPPTGKLRDRIGIYREDDHVSVLQRLQELSAVIGGPEWTIDPEWADADQTAVQLVFRVASRIGVAAAEPKAIFEASAHAVFGTEGSTDASYTYSEDHTERRAANYVVAYSTGKGEDKVVSAPAIDHDALAAGVPILQHTFSAGSNITDQATIDGHAQRRLELLRHGARTWTITARWNAYPRYGVDWRLGDDVAWDLTGHRHPDGVAGRGRVVGWRMNIREGSMSPVLLDPIEGLT